MATSTNSRSAGSSRSVCSAQLGRTARWNRRRLARAREGSEHDQRGPAAARNSPGDRRRPGSSATAVAATARAPAISPKRNWRRQRVSFGARPRQGIKSASAAAGNSGERARRRAGAPLARGDWRECGCGHRRRAGAARRRSPPVRSKRIPQKEIDGAPVQRSARIRRRARLRLARVNAQRGGTRPKQPSEAVMPRSRTLVP